MGAPVVLLLMLIFLKDVLFSSIFTHDWPELFFVNIAESVVVFEFKTTVTILNKFNSDVSVTEKSPIPKN